MATEANPFYPFISSILRPQKYNTLKKPYSFRSIQISVFRSPSQDPEVFELDEENFYTFYTVDELALRIYELTDFNDAFHPKYQCLLVPTDDGRYTHLQYLFNREKSFLKSPFDTLREGSKTSLFVNLEGQTQDVAIASRRNCLVESTLFPSQDEDTLQVHCYLYSDMLGLYTGDRPVSYQDWFAVFKVYFPELESDDDGELSESEQTYLKTWYERFSSKDTIVKQLDYLLQENESMVGPGNSAGGDAVRLNNFKNLRLGWLRPLSHVNHLKYKSFRLDTLFYNFSVSEEVPYMRLYPRNSTPISKIHVKGPLNEPALETPEILLDWAKDQTPKPNEDVLVAKILLRKGSGVLFPLYATFTIFQDGSAFFHVQPPKDVRVLTTSVDLRDLADTLFRTVKAIPKLEPLSSTDTETRPAILYRAEDLQLLDAYAVLEYNGTTESPPLTKAFLRQILPYYRAFFQITSSPIKEQNPLVFLRYKTVNNFSTPARDFQFLYRVAQLQKLEGVIDYKAMVPYYLQEFDVSEEIAKQRIGQFIEVKDNLQPIETETSLKYEQVENPGIDINLFGRQHPYYTFHIYRVDSLETLQRIKTILSLLVNIKPDQLSGLADSANELAEEYEGDQEDADSVAGLQTAQGMATETNRDPRLNAAAAKVTGLAEADEEDLFASLTGLGTADDAREFSDGTKDLLGFTEETKQEETVPSLASLAAADQPSTALPPPQVKAKKAKKPTQKQEEEEEEEERQSFSKESAKSYFRKRLQAYDKILFSYPATTTVKAYPELCMANAMRQPAIMTEDEFSRMKELYAKDIEEGRIMFLEMPVPKKGAKPQPKSAKTEIVRAMHYGSNQLPGQTNVLLCSEYWCKNENLVLIGDDFRGTKDRKGRDKEANTCPFCRGTEITNRDVSLPGESVFVRAKGDVKPLHIAFLTKVRHPQNLYLPCCFIPYTGKDESKDKLYTIEDPPFRGQKQSAIYAVRKEAAPLHPVEAARIQMAAQKSGIPIQTEAPKEILNVNYNNYQKIISSYILKAETFPLTLEYSKKEMMYNPQLGMVPKGADTYFAQDSLKYLVKQDHTVWKLMTDNATGEANVSGFFRMGVDNRSGFEADSFLAALCPYYNMKNTAQMRNFLFQAIQPKVFLSLNYGNFLFDFYETNTSSPPMDAFTRLPNFKGIHVGKDKAAFQRLIKAWFYFKTAVMSKSTKLKQYRQFAQLLTYPNFLPAWDPDREEALENGILFIVLEVNQNGVVEVRCPPYGVTTKMQETCDVAFLLHYWNGLWEPVFYTRNDPDADIHETRLIFTQETRADWPQIVKDRFDEYCQMCKRSGLGMYMDSPLVSPQALLPLSVLVDSDRVNVTGILRDAYNHVSAALVKLPNETYVPIPAIDDGGLYPNLDIELSWTNILDAIASGDEILAYYKAAVAPLLVGYPKASPSYTVKRQIRMDKTLVEKPDVVLLQMETGLFVPARKTDAFPEELESEIGEAHWLTWAMNSKLVFGEQKASAKEELSHQDFQEIYEHLRLSFSNWLRTKPNAKRDIEKILFVNNRPNPNMTVQQKRSALFTLLGYEVLSWLDSTLPKPDRKPSLKRLDCPVLTSKERCGESNRCVWQEESGRCLIHVPETYTVGAQEVDAKIVMVLRLIEELVRFPLRREELMKKGIGEYRKLLEPIRVQNEYIIPEVLPAWNEWLHMDWKHKDSEQDRYIEEMGNAVPFEEEEEEETKEEEEEEPLVPLTEIPEPLRTALGDSAKSLVFYEMSPTTSLTQVLQSLSTDPLFSEKLTEKGQPDESPLFVDELPAKYVAQRLSRTVFQMIYEPGDDSGTSYETLVAKLMLPNKQAAPVLFVVQLPDETRGILSASPALPLRPIPISILPKALAFEIKKKPAFDASKPL